MISMGVSMQALSHVTEPQFISGGMLLLSIVESLFGLGMIIKYLLK